MSYACVDVWIGEHCSSNIHLTSIRKQHTSSKELLRYVQGRQLRRWLLVSLYTVIWKAEVALMRS